MKEQLIKEITDEVVKYVPDVMELKFGCKLKYVFDTGIVLGVNPESISDRYTIAIFNIFKSGLMTTVSKTDIKKYDIVGRDITLEDILIAVKEKDKSSYIIPRGVFVNEYGIFYKMLEEKNIEKQKCPIVLQYKNLGWQLGKPLHEQSIETLQFIKGIIK